MSPLGSRIDAALHAKILFLLTSKALFRKLVGEIGQKNTTVDQNLREIKNRYLTEKRCLQEKTAKLKNK